MSATQQRPHLTRIMAQSARSGPNLLALGMSLAAALLLGNVWLLIAGTGLYGLLIARNSTTARFWRLVADGDAERARQLPDETSLTDPALRLIVSAIRKGYDEIARVMRETPEPVKVHLRAAVTSLNDVRAQAAQLLRDADQLGRYLLTRPVEMTQTAIQKLSQEIPRSADEGVKRHHEGALAIRRDQLAAVSQVAIEHERLLAALQLIVGTVEAFPAWIYRIRVLESRAKEDRAGDIYDEVLHMQTELFTSQHLLEGLARSPGHYLCGDDEPRSEPACSAEMGSAAQSGNAG